MLKMNLILRPIAHTTQLVIQGFQNAVSSVTQARIFSNTYRLVSEAVQKLRSTITDWSRHFPAMTSLFSKDTVRIPTQEVEIPVEVDLTGFMTEPDASVTRRQETRYSKNSISDHLSLKIEELVKPLGIQSETVRGQVVDLLTCKFLSHGTPEVRGPASLSKIRSLLSETNRFLRIGDSLGQLRDDVVIDALSTTPEVPFDEVYQELAALFPKEKSEIFTRTLKGDLVEMNMEARRFLKAAGDLRASSHRELMKRLYASGTHWRLVLSTDADDGEEITNRMTVQREPTVTVYASHNELKDIQSQAEAISRLMGYPNSQRIAYRHTLIEILKNKSDWRSYAAEFLKTLKVAHQLGIKNAHYLMKEIAKRIEEEPFLEAFKFLSNCRPMTGDARRYFFTLMALGKLRPPIAVLKAKSLNEGMATLQPQPNGSFLIIPIPLQAASKARKKRVGSGAYAAAGPSQREATNEKGGHSGQHQPASQGSFFDVEAKASA